MARGKLLSQETLYSCFKLERRVAECSDAMSDVWQEGERCHHSRIGTALLARARGRWFNPHPRNILLSGARKWTPHSLMTVHDKEVKSSGLKVAHENVRCFREWKYRRLCHRVKLRIFCEHLPPGLLTCCCQSVAFFKNDFQPHERYIYKPKLERGEKDRGHERTQSSTHFLLLYQI